MRQKLSPKLRNTLEGEVRVTSDEIEKLYKMSLKGLYIVGYEAMIFYTFEVFKRMKRILIDRDRKKFLLFLAKCMKLFFCTYAFKICKGDTMTKRNSFKDAIYLYKAEFCASFESVYSHGPKQDLRYMLAN
jgi:hypothetical protein